ncbi:unnamed protein product [Prunus brigantina]
MTPTLLDMAQIFGFRPHGRPVDVVEETHKFMVQTIKAINAQAIEDPSLTRNIGGQFVQAGEVIVTSVIAARDLELPFGDEEDETLAEQPTVEATPSARRKRKETAPTQDSAAQPEISAESPPPPPTRSKRLRKRTGVESDETEEPAAVPTETSGTDVDELREAFEVVEQEKENEREEEGDVPSKKEKEKDLEEEVIFHSSGTIVLYLLLFFLTSNF